MQFTLELHRIDLKVLEYNKRAISCYKNVDLRLKHSAVESAYIQDK